MLSKFSVKKPYTIFVAVILIIILGVISFTSMTTDLLPSMDLPYAIISTTYIGASPEKIETMVTKPLEQSMSTVSSVKNVSSVSNENYSMVIIEFTNDVNMDSVLIEINSKIDIAKASFEEGIGMPTVMKLNPNMMPIMMSAIDIQGLSNVEVTKILEESIIPELERTNGVASVESTGLIKEEIQIKLNQDKIDNINKKVLESINSNLVKTQTQLNTARQQIFTGKQELQNQSVTQIEKITQGLNAVNQGIQKIDEGKEEIARQETTLNLSKQALTTTLQGINLVYSRLENEKNELLKLENLTQLQQKRLDKINTHMKALEKEKNTINEQLLEVISGVSKIEEAKRTINVQKTNLTNQKSQLEQARITITQELNKASIKLETGEQELNRGIKEFEEAREKAYKSASLEGVITQNMISNILKAQNFSMPAGYIENGDNQITVKVGEQFENIEEIKNLTLFSFEISGLENVTLQDLTDIYITDNSDKIYAKVNGNDAVVLSFQKQSTASTADVCKEIQNTMKNITDQNDDSRFTILMNQGMYIDVVISSVLDNLIYGGILAIIILFLFLKSFKTTLIVAISIPISLTFAIALMYFTGVTINIISLSGLALGVGMLVDNSIVVIENIYRLRNQGMDIKHAAIEGAASVGGAIIASTLTTICVFLPIVFVQGVSRQLFTDMGLTIAYSLIASLIIALTLVPAMASGMLKKSEEKENKLFNKIIKIYETLLKNVLNHKTIILVISVIILIFSGFMATKMGTAFMPTTEGEQISLVLEVPKETTNDQLIEISNDTIEKLLKIEDIEVVGAIKGGAMDIMSSNTGKSIQMYIIIKEDRKHSNNQIENKIYELTEDLNCKITVSTSDMDMSAMSGSGINVKIKGDNLDKLQEIAKDVSNILKNTEGTQEIDDGMQEALKETRIIVNKNEAMKYGLTVAQIYSEIANELKNNIESTKVTLNKKDYSVVIVKSTEERMTQDNFMSMELNGKKDQKEVKVKLSEVASIENADSLSSISHENQERYMSVTANIDKDHNIGIVSREFKKVLDEYNVPEGYEVELSGENETINESLTDLGKMIALAVLFIYLIMVAQFQSLLSPFIVMFTIPLAFTGGLLALFITGTEISIIAMLGFLVLAGIVVNNGIVFVDYTNQLRKEGMEKKKALLQAGKTRIRPIMMTALTTILGLSTMALGIGDGADMVQPIGIVTVGGLIYATLLTLFIVPCLYDIFVRK